MTMETIWEIYNLITWVLNLHRHLTAVMQCRGVHLPNAGRRSGLSVKLGKSGLPVSAKFGFQLPFQLAARHNICASTHTLQRRLDLQV